MAANGAIGRVLAKLNPQQRAAATHGQGPLLIVAGAGTGKTATLVHRVAWLISQGVDPGRILLLTFTRRAAAEMLRRADLLLRQMAGETAETAAEPPAAGPGLFLPTPLGPAEDDAPAPAATPCKPKPAAAQIARAWGGTFHAVATRLLRRYGKAIGLSPEFSIHDQSDSEDLMNVVRTDLGLAKTTSRFPKKGTCLAIYSRCVNGRDALEPVLAKHFPWCRDAADDLKRLFNAYVDRKEAAVVLDYDDLLLHWSALLHDPQVGPSVRDLFDCVLVDEYQDTNLLQAEIVAGLSPEGKGLTVVGDDAQSIYAFRAATVRNILDFPKQYPAATIVTLEQNYRSTCPILSAANSVIAAARERYTKNLWSDRAEGERPELVTCEDEDEQTDYVVHRILERREAGIDLRRQAVLFRASYHSMMLEAELARRNIPFHKYGGLKFVETAHVKDLMAFLRLAENPRDVVAGTRVVLLLPGVGPGKARQLVQVLADAGGSFAAWKTWKPPAGAATAWPKFLKLIESLATTTDPLPVQVARVRKFYSPMVETLYDNPVPRQRDLEQLEQIAGRYANRARMLAEITLDPPSSTQDLAGPPRLDDDYLVLSTIHSAKGLEWDAVYVIHASDGNIPSDMSTGSGEQIEEELRLFYVALTRAKNYLHVLCPMRYYYSRPGRSDAHGYAQPTRFLTRSAMKEFERRIGGLADDEAAGPPVPSAHYLSRHARRKTKDLWR